MIKGLIYAKLFMVDRALLPELEIEDSEPIKDSLQIVEETQIQKDENIKIDFVDWLFMNSFRESVQAEFAAIAEELA